jgi:hypothetical protein
MLNLVARDPKTNLAVGVPPLLITSEDELTVFELGAGKTLNKI